MGRVYGWRDGRGLSLLISKAPTCRKVADRVFVSATPDVIPQYLILLSGHYPSVNKDRVGSQRLM